MVTSHIGKRFGKNFHLLRIYCFVAAAPTDAASLLASILKWWIQIYTRTTLQHGATYVRSRFIVCQHIRGIYFGQHFHGWCAQLEYSNFYFVSLFTVNGSNYHSL